MKYINTKCRSPKVADNIYNGIRKYIDEDKTFGQLGDIFTVEDDLGKIYVIPWIAYRRDSRDIIENDIIDKYIWDDMPFYESLDESHPTKELIDAINETEYIINHPDEFKWYDSAEELHGDL